MPHKKYGRSEQASEYRWLYGTSAWKTLSKVQLAREPLCRLCLNLGNSRWATVADHIKRHSGDRMLFFDPDNLQSLCKSCHDSTKQAEEIRGYSVEVGEDGRPIDRKHPFYGNP
jgi:5-methylcytosine-specific restriction protein A